MPAFEVPHWFLATAPVVFMFAVGACVGSFLNVVAHRMPRGMGLFSPGSRCPVCETPLTWKQNFPVFGWLALRGKCRFCRSPIAPEYPLVELATGLLFAGLYAAWFLPDAMGVWAASASAPEWTRAGMWRTWPLFTIVLALVGSLIAMTLIDARTFTIPLALPWFAASVGVAFHTLHAMFVQHRYGSLTFGKPDWSLPTVGPVGFGAAVGGLLGVGVSLLLIRARLLRRSFDGYAAWEEAERARIAAGGPPPTLTDNDDHSIRGTFVRALALTGPSLVLMAVGFNFGLRYGQPFAGMGFGALIGLVVGAGLRAWVVRRRIPGAVRVPALTPPVEPSNVATRAQQRAVRWVIGLTPIALFGALGWMLDTPHLLTGLGMGVLVSVLALDATSAEPPAEPPQDHGTMDDPSFWLAYPFARREMARELAFFAAPLALGLAGMWLGAKAGTEAPLWMAAMGGSILGYLVGGGVVWGIRIVGTLLLGKEAMGMGDVHLMAAVGAALGWIDPLLAFFTAPLFGLSWAMLSAVSRGSRIGALPFGPHLALATIAVIAAKPWYEALLARLMREPINLP